MKALDEYILMALFVLSLKRVHFLDICSKSEQLNTYLHTSRVHHMCNVKLMSIRDFSRTVIFKELHQCKTRIGVIFKAVVVPRQSAHKDMVPPELFCLSQLMCQRPTKEVLRMRHQLSLIDLEGSQERHNFLLVVKYG